MMYGRGRWVVLGAVLASLLLAACQGRDGRRGRGGGGGGGGSDGGMSGGDGSTTTDAGTDAGGLPCEGEDGTACDDGDACTTGDVCTAGVCRGTPLDCSELDDVCQEGQCNPATGSCVAAPLGEGTACDDGDPCTDGDACNAAGDCEPGGPTDCSSLTDECNVGMCDASMGAAWRCR